MYVSVSVCVQLSDNSGCRVCKAEGWWCTLGYLTGNMGTAPGLTDNLKNHRKQKDWPGSWAVSVSAHAWTGGLSVCKKTTVSVSVCRSLATLYRRCRESILRAGAWPPLVKQVMTGASQQGLNGLQVWASSTLRQTDRTRAQSLQKNRRARALFHTDSSPMLCLCMCEYILKLKYGRG